MAISDAPSTLSWEEVHEVPSLAPDSCILPPLHLRRVTFHQLKTQNPCGEQVAAGARG
jgi:hypothetical protein